MRRAQDRARSARSRKNGARSATIESRSILRAARDARNENVPAKRAHFFYWNFINLFNMCETKISKVWHRKGIYGQTRQIISKTKKETYIGTSVFDYSHIMLILCFGSVWSNNKLFHKFVMLLGWFLHLRWFIRVEKFWIFYSRFESLYIQIDHASLKLNFFKKLVVKIYISLKKCFWVKIIDLLISYLTCYFFP